MIDLRLDDAVAARARALDIDWRNAWIGPTEAGPVATTEESAADALGVGRLEAQATRRICTALEPLRQIPAHRGEMVSEIRGAELLVPFVHEDEWWLVRGEDDYVGWIHEWVLVGFDAQTRAEAKRGCFASYAKPLGTLWMSDHHAASPLVMGTPLFRVDSDLSARANWRLIETLNGEQGWVEVESLREGSLATTKAVLDAARSLVGTPYRWGGRSPLGFDCSGFVQFVFELGASCLPRDAAQQQHGGTQIGLDPEHWKSGDLLFFGEEADHVGIYDGRGAMLHCRGAVRRDPLGDITPLMERLSAVVRVELAKDAASPSLWVPTPRG